jgi:hypothetical protein
MARWKERMHNVQSIYVNDISNPNKAKERRIDLHSWAV